MHGNRTRQRAKRLGFWGLVPFGLAQNGMLGAGVDVCFCPEPSGNYSCLDNDDDSIKNTSPARGSGQILLPYISRNKLP